MNSIYALVDPRNNELRYIGKSRNPWQRLKAHCYGKNRTHSSRWIQGLKRIGLFPKMLVIEEGLAEHEWPTREQFWISHYRNLGANLTNITDGGHHIVKVRREFAEELVVIVQRDGAEALAKNPELHGTEHRVLWFILSRMRYDGKSFPKQAAIAEALSMPKSQVSVAVKRLVECGAITKIKEDGNDGFQVHPSLASRGSQTK